MKAPLDNKIALLLKKILSFPHRAFSFPYKSKMGPDGLLYASQFLRSLTILGDLLFLIFVMHCMSYFFAQLFDMQFPLEIIEKSNLKIKITQQENAALVLYYKKIFLLQILQILFLGFFVIFMWQKFAATPAKLLFGIRILEEKGLTNPSLSSCFKRFFMFPISVFCLFLGMIWPVFDKKGRTWHDIAAGTVVVMKKSIKTNA